MYTVTPHTTIHTTTNACSMYINRFQAINLNVELSPNKKYLGLMKNHKMKIQRIENTKIEKNRKLFINFTVSIAEAS